MTQDEVLKFIKKKGWVSATEIKKHFKKNQDNPPSTINKNLFRLYWNGDVVRIKKKEGGYSVYQYRAR